MNYEKKINYIAIVYNIAYNNSREFVEEKTFLRSLKLLAVNEKDDHLKCKPVVKLIIKNLFNFSFILLFIFVLY